MKTFDQLDKEDAPNIHKMMSPQERKLRSILLDKILHLKGPVLLSEIMSQAGDADIDVSPTVESLKEKGLIALEDDGGVTGLYPFSAVPTRHKVQLKDGRSVFAMCAIDSLGVAGGECGYFFIMFSTVLLLPDSGKGVRLSSRARAKIILRCCIVVRIV